MGSIKSFRKDCWVVLGVPGVNLEDGLLPGVKNRLCSNHPHNYFFEILVGYYTKYDASSGDINPIGSLPKIYVNNRNEILYQKWQVYTKKTSQKHARSNLGNYGIP